MIDLVLWLSSMLSRFTAVTTFAAIKLYASRNQVASPHIWQLMRKGHTAPAAAKMVDDYYNMLLEGVVTDEEQVKTRECMITSIGFNFKRFVIGDGHLVEYDC